MLVIRLQRTGKRNDATFRIVVAEKHAAVKGGVLEVIGHYLPTRDPVQFECDTLRVTQWIEKGAQPSSTLARLLAKQGMSGLETYIKAYTKRQKRKLSEEKNAHQDVAHPVEKAGGDTKVPQPPQENSALEEEGRNK